MQVILPPFTLLERRQKLVLKNSKANAMGSRDHLTLWSKGVEVDPLLDVEVDPLYEVEISTLSPL